MNNQIVNSFRALGKENYNKVLKIFAILIAVVFFDKQISSDNPFFPYVQ